MHKVIDCASNIGDYAAQLKTSGVDTVIRYYNRANSSAHPSKRLEKAEADALVEAGLSLCTVFQQRGGADGNIQDLDAASGKADAQQALKLAAQINQPHGSAVYFAVDHDYYKQSEIAKILPYFQAVAQALAGSYRVGVYGSGAIGKAMRDAGYAELIWLAAATGWSGTKKMLQTDQWALYQTFPAESWNGKFSYDGNIVGGKWKDFGQFRLDGGGAISGPTEDLSAAVATPAVLSEVIATGGLNLRRGPSETFAVERTFAPGTLVTVLEHNGDWAKVDINGDGTADGYMYGGYLRAISGGLPLVLAPASTPYDIARSELSLGVMEVPGAGNNPRIVMYHKTTHHWSGTDDEVSWCSSFMNYCVEQAGYVGTDSQSARSWTDWGQDVTNAPREGDIAVFSRTNDGKSGHVGFFVEDLGGWVKILGGNQSDRVKYSNYPKNGVVGNVPYQLLSVRRP